MIGGGTGQAVPKAAREQRKAEVSHIARDVIECPTTTALNTGVSRTLVRQWADAESDTQIGVADAAGLGPLQRMPLAEYVAGPGYMMAELPACEETARAGIELHVRVLRETTEVVTAHAIAISDGRVDRREGAVLEREIDDAIRALLTLRECARQAQREGVVGAVISIAKGGSR